MNIKNIVPRSLVRYYYNRKASKGHKGICIANDVDLRNVKLSNYVNFAHHAQASNSIIGERTSIGRYSKVAYAHIGKFCSISWDVTIGAITHPMHSISSHAFTYKTKFGFCKNEETLKKITHEYVTIENDVWIGCGVIIMPGVHIGNGAIIGGGSFVNHPVADYEIVGGVPARHIGWRFEEDIREKLLDVEWWNFTEEEIKNNFGLFSPFNDITKDKDILNKLISIKNEKKSSVPHR